jgi:hypothetical protein
LLDDAEPRESHSMELHDLAIPTLPCRSVSATVAFDRRLGFEGGAHESNSEYAILRRGAVELLWTLTSTT